MESFAFAGDLDMRNKRITRVGMPASSTDALRVIDLIDKNCNINACKRRLVEIADPIDSNDAINLKYLQTKSLMKSNDDLISVNARLTNLEAGSAPNDAITVSQLFEALEKSVHRIMVPTEPKPLTARLREVRSIDDLPPAPWPLSEEEALEINKASIILSSLPDRIDALEINSLIDRGGIVDANNSRISSLKEGENKTDAVNLAQLLKFRAEAELKLDNLDASYMKKLNDLQAYTLNELNKNVSELKAYDLTQSKQIIDLNKNVSELKASDLIYSKQLSDLKGSDLSYSKQLIELNRNVNELKASDLIHSKQLTDLNLQTKNEQNTLDSRISELSNEQNSFQTNSHTKLNELKAEQVDANLKTELLITELAKLKTQFNTLSVNLRQMSALKLQFNELDDRVKSIENEQKSISHFGASAARDVFAD